MSASRSMPLGASSFEVRRAAVHRLAIALALLLQAGAAVLQRSFTQTAFLHGNDSSVEGDNESCPSLFVAVITTPDNVDRRAYIRKMWRDAGAGWGKVGYKFAVCAGKNWVNMTQALWNEHKQEEDMMIMECEEGYMNGILTLKVQAAMDKYTRKFMEDYSLFMKIDDDTFISTRRLCEFMKRSLPSWKRTTSFYLGVFAEGDENMDTKHPPCRDRSNPWFEPWTNYAAEFYPVSAKGGPGYMLASNLVKSIIADGIADRNELNNEDKAVGYWVEKLVDVYGVNVTYLNVPGTDGYEEHQQWIITSGPYGDYPHIMHHHLTGMAIACLHDVEASGDPSRRIDDCFPKDARASLAERSAWGASFTPSGPRIHMPF